jgi:hypothetical protein
MRLVEGGDMVVSIGLSLCGIRDLMTSEGWRFGGAVMSMVLRTLVLSRCGGEECSSCIFWKL